MMMRRLAWLLIVVGLAAGYVGATSFVPDEPEVRPARPATQEEIRRYELERLVDLMRECGEDRQTPPCDQLPREVRS